MWLKKCYQPTRVGLDFLKHIIRIYIARAFVHWVLLGYQFKIIVVFSLVLLREKSFIEQLEFARNVVGPVTEDLGRVGRILQQLHFLLERLGLAAQVLYALVHQVAQPCKRARQLPANDSQLEINLYHNANIIFVSKWFVGIFIFHQTNFNRMKNLIKKNYC